MMSKGQDGEAPLRLLKMEDELAGPRGAEALVAYDGQLLALSRRCTSAMDAGLTPEDFERCRMLQEAVTAARKIICFQQRHA